MMTSANKIRSQPKMDPLQYKLWIISSAVTFLLLTFSTFGEGSSFQEYSSSARHDSTSTDNKQQQQQSSSSITPRYSYHPHFHRCYVCLPDDRNSAIAKEIIATFPGQNVSDCSYFDSQTNVNLNPHTQFIFSCPINSSGCLLRTHGSSVSRTCAQFPINDCKVANSIELCYCTGTLCNKDRTKFSTLPLSLAHSELIVNNNNKDKSNVFEEGETDDEDLLGPLRNGFADGSGDGPLQPPDQSTSSSSSSGASGSDKSIDHHHHHEQNNNNNNHEPKYHNSNEDIPTNRIDDDDNGKKSNNSAATTYLIANFNSFSIVILFQIILYRNFWLIR